MKKILISTIIISLLVLLVASANNNNNNTNESSNHTIQNSTCPAFTILNEKEHYAHEEKITYAFSEWEEGDSITYWIEDLFGKIWKKAYTSTNNNKKSYTPKIDEEDRVLIIKAEREREGCPRTFTEAQVIIIRNKSIKKENTTNTSINETPSTENNKTEEKEKSEEEELEEDIEITYYDDEVESGKKLEIRFTIQKNSNRNNAFYVWIENEDEEKISETKINLHQKGSYEFELLFPLRITSCGNAFERHYIHIKGLGKEETEKIFVLQESCPEKEECELTIENDIILEENPITSLYVRAQKWQEEINLYSTVEENMSVHVFGPLAQKEHLHAGSNSISIQAQVGNNTYALVNSEGKGKIVSFYLKGEEKEIEKESVTLYTNTKKEEQENRGIYTQEAEENSMENITGAVIYTEEKKGKLGLLLGVLVLSILGLGYKERRKNKGKALRNKKTSKKTRWQTKNSARRTSKKKSTKATYMQTLSSK